MTQERLSMIAPHLAASLGSIGDEFALRRAALEAVIRVIDRAAIDDPRVLSAIEVLSAGTGDERLRSELEQYAHELDKSSWDIQDSWEAGTVAEEEYLAAFARARAVSALAWALHSNPRLGDSIPIAS